MSNLTAIKYVGKRLTYTDGTYGTRITFTQGQTLMVPADKAALMLRHADVYAPGKYVKEVAIVAAVTDKPDEQTQDVRDSIANMDKTALETFVKTNYSVDLDKRKSLASLRAEATGLVDQYGAK